MERDLAKSLRYCELAAAQGFQYAIESLDVIKGKIAEEGKGEAGAELDR